MFATIVLKVGRTPMQTLDPNETIVTRCFRQRKVHYTSALLGRGSWPDLCGFSVIY